SRDWSSDVCSSDLVGATTNDHDLLALGRCCFTLLLIGGVHISRGGRKLCSTGINPLVDRPNIQRQTLLTHRLLTQAQQFGQACIREALALQAPDIITGQVSLTQFEQAGLFLNDIFALSQAPGVHATELVNLWDPHPGTEGITDIPNAVCTGIHQLSSQGLTSLFGLKIQFRIKTGGAY